MNPVDGEVGAACRRDGAIAARSPEFDSGRAGRFQADARIRTADPFITSEVLYQLSYVGEAGSV
jgi:hypothetical protein